MNVDARYLSDWSGMKRGQPDELHRPRTTDELSAVMRSCCAEGRKVTIQGGLTGLAGGAVPGASDVVINLEKMNAIEEIDALEGVMVVQAGVTLEQVQQAANDAGWYFPVDLGARGSCHIGGNASTNAGGERVLRYGTMRENILGLEAVLPDGIVLSAMNRLVKNSVGPDLKHLFIGAEGTLGVITRLVLKLQPAPGKSTCALVDLSQLSDVPSLLKHLRQSLGPLLTAYEFMSAEFVSLSRNLSGKPPIAEMDAPWKVLVEVSDVAALDAGKLLEANLMSLMESGQITNALVSQSEQDRQAFWSIRHAIPEVLSHLKPTVNFDVGLPWKHMAAYIENLACELHARYPEARHLFFGHLGDNNLHLITGPHTDHHDEVEDIVYGALAGLNGTISAEHGIGFLKKPYLHKVRGPQELQLIRDIKHCIDPKGILNPERII